MKGVANKKCNTLQQNCKQKHKDKNNNQKKRLKAQNRGCKSWKDVMWVDKALYNATNEGVDSGS